jgi:hypothetical protein
MFTHDGTQVKLLLLYADDKSEVKFVNFFGSPDTEEKAYRLAIESLRRGPGRSMEATHFFPI